MSLHPWDQLQIEGQQHSFALKKKMFQFLGVSKAKNLKICKTKATNSFERYVVIRVDADGVLLDENVSSLISSFLSCTCGAFDSATSSP